MDLLLQLSAAMLLFVACAIIHGTGVVFMSKLFEVEEREVKRQHLAVREMRLMVPMALCLFILHTLEIMIFAAFYLSLGTHDTFEQALFYSASAYTTLGHPEPALDGWRVVGAFEGLTGFIMIGWSAAILVTDMEKVLRKRF